MWVRYSAADAGCGALVMLTVSLLFNNLWESRAYPIHHWTPLHDPALAAACSSAASYFMLAPPPAGEGDGLQGGDVELRAQDGDALGSAEDGGLSLAESSV